MADQLNGGTLESRTQIFVVMTSVFLYTLDGENFAKTGMRICRV